MCRQPATHISVTKNKLCFFSIRFELGQEELTIGCMLLPYSCFSCLPPPLRPPPSSFASVCSPSFFPLSRVSAAQPPPPLLCHGVGAREWRIIIRYSTEHSVDSPSEPQFHISSRKMPALTVAGSRLKNQVCRATGRPICSKKPLKWEERSGVSENISIGCLKFAC